MFSYGPIVSYMVGKIGNRRILWYKARNFWGCHLGYRILVTLWQQSLHYSRDLVFTSHGVSDHQQGLSSAKVTCSPWSPWTTCALVCPLPGQSCWTTYSTPTAAAHMDNPPTLGTATKSSKAESAPGNLVHLLSWQ